MNKKDFNPTNIKNFYEKLKPKNYKLQVNDQDIFYILNDEQLEEIKDIIKKFEESIFKNEHIFNFSNDKRKKHKNILIRKFKGDDQIITFDLI